jgi:UDP:flavonoid glycosyltransferase YjiC (YdhE family)
MTIVWFCIPAHGHTNPTLGVVKALTEAGHEIYFFSYEMFREKILATGAHFFPCDDYNFEEQDPEYADKVGRDQSFAVKLMVNATIGLDEMVSQKIREIQPDVIVSDSVAYWGKLAAMKSRYQRVLRKQEE